MSVYFAGSVEETDFGNGPTETLRSALKRYAMDIVDGRIKQLFPFLVSGAVT